jgi:hypothetical protein
VPSKKKTVSNAKNAEGSKTQKQKRKGRPAGYGNISLTNEERLDLEEVNSFLKRFGNAFQTLHALEARCSRDVPVHPGIAENDLMIFIRDLLLIFSDERKTLIREIDNELRELLKKHTDSTGRFSEARAKRDLINLQEMPLSDDPFYRPKLDSDKRALVALYLQKALKTRERKYFVMAGKYIDFTMATSRDSEEDDWEQYFEEEFRKLPSSPKGGRKRYNICVRFVAKHYGVSSSQIDKEVRDFQKRHKDDLA